MRRIPTLTPAAERLDQLQEYILTRFAFNGQLTQHGDVAWLVFKHHTIDGIRLLYNYDLGIMRLQDENNDVHEFDLSDPEFAVFLISIEIAKAARMEMPEQTQTRMGNVIRRARDVKARAGRVIGYCLNCWSQPLQERVRAVDGVHGAM